MQDQSAAAWLQFVALRHEGSPTLLAFSEKVGVLLRKYKCIPVEGAVPFKMDVPGCVLVCPPAFARLFDSSWLRGATGCARMASFVGLERDRALLRFLGCNVDIGFALQRCLAFELNCSTARQHALPIFIPGGTKCSCRVSNKATGFSPVQWRAIFTSTRPCVRAV